MIHPIRHIQLEMANKEWQRAIKQIRMSGDYGMCANEKCAIDCAKHYYFGKLIKYADKYTPEG